MSNFTIVIEVHTPDNQVLSSTYTMAEQASTKDAWVWTMSQLSLEVQEEIAKKGYLHG